MRPLLCSGLLSFTPNWLQIKWSLRQLDVARSPEGLKSPILWVRGRVRVDKARGGLRCLLAASTGWGCLYTGRGTQAPMGEGRWLVYHQYYVHALIVMFCASLCSRIPLLPWICLVQVQLSSTETTLCCGVCRCVCVCVARTWALHLETNILSGIASVVYHLVLRCTCNATHRCD